MGLGEATTKLVILVSHLPAVLITFLLFFFYSSFRNLTRNITLPGIVSWAEILAAMLHTRQSTSSIFTWVKLQSSSSSQAR